MRILNLIMISLFLIFVAGCSSTNIAVIDEPIETITYENNKLLEGDSYVADLEINVTAGDIIYIAGVTTDLIAMTQRQVIATSEGLIDVSILLYENSSYDNGIIIKNFNKQRNLDDDSTFKTYYDINNITLGEKLPFRSVITGDKRTIATTTNFIYYVMKKNNNYILAITNNEIKDVELILVWNWLELD